MNRSTVWSDRGLLVLRLALGVVFVMHGWQKVFVYGHEGVTGMLAQLGVPFPGLNAVLLAATELGGGLALLAGAGTRVAAGLLTFAMAIAIATVHLAGGFFAPTGVEFPLTLALVSLAVVFTGAGRYSADARFASRRETPQHQTTWKVAA